MHLVLQGRAITQAHLAHIHSMIGSHAQFMQIGALAYSLPLNAGDFSAAKSFCKDQKIDYALVRHRRPISQYGLCVMDMDSTLISIECIDEVADMMGIKPKISEITQAAMRGELDFAASLKRRIALLAGLDEAALQRVIDERLTLNPGVRAWIATCKEHDIKTMVVSGGFTFFAHHVKGVLDLDYAVSNVLEIIDGKLTGQVVGDIVDAQRKADELLKLRDQLNLGKEQTIAIGDGANDLKMMAAADISIAYHAKPIVQEQATYALNHSGLEGAIYLFTT